MPSPINHYLLLISDVKSAGGYPSRPWVRRQNSPRTGHYSKKIPRLNQVQNLVGLRGQPIYVPTLLTTMLTTSPKMDQFIPLQIFVLGKSTLTAYVQSLLF